MTNVKPDQGDYRVEVPEQVISLLRRTATGLDLKLPEGWGFGVFLFEYGDAKGRMAWISSAARAEMVKALQEWIKRNSDT